MINFFSSVESRHFQIIRFLYEEYEFEEKNYHYLADIRKSLKINNKTLLSDIEQINDTIPYIKILLNGDFIQIKIDENKSIDLIYAYFLNNNATFKLLEKIFLDDQLSINELADDLFLSPSTIYRLFSKANETFKEKNIDIYLTTNPCQIKGDEKLVRHFMTQLFGIRSIKIYENTINLPLIEFVLERFQVLIQGTTGASYADYRNLLILFFVNYVRYSQGHLVPDIYMFEANYQMFTNDRDTVQAFEKLIQTPCNEESLTQVLTPLVNHDTFFLIDRLALDKLGELCPKCVEVVHDIKDMLTKLCQKYNIQIKNETAIIIALYNGWVNFEYHKRIINIIDRYNYLKKLFQNDNPSFYEDIVDATKALSQKIYGEVIEEFSSYLLDLLILNWEDLAMDLNLFNIPIKLLIINHISQNNANLLKNMIEVNITTQLTIDLWDKNDYSLGTLPLDAYDIVISSLPIPSSDNTIIYNTSGILDNHLEILLITMIHHVRVNRVKEKYN